MTLYYIYDILCIEMYPTGTISCLNAVSMLGQNPQNVSNMHASLSQVSAGWVVTVYSFLCSALYYITVYASTKSMVKYVANKFVTNSS